VVDFTVVTDAGGSWRDAVDLSRQATLAHAAEWFTVIKRAYGHDPLYLTAVDGESGCGLLPAFIVRRPLFGTVVTSMPFLDSGGPCAPSPAVANLLAQRLIAEARDRGARLVELRCAARLAIGAQPMESKVNMTLALPANPDGLWRRFDSALRNQIRKAERVGLSIESGGVANLAAFYDTFVERMRDLGSPVHAVEFLRAVIDSFGQRARIVLVKKGRTPIGGLIALAFKDRLIVPWSTCRKDYFALCPNMLLYWDTIKSACAEGFRCFDFGRSTRQSGTYHFKQQWGAQEEPLFWYRIPIASRQTSDVSASSRGTGAMALSTMWRHLPLPVTRQIGPYLRKYLIQ